MEQSREVEFILTATEVDALNRAAQDQAISGIPAALHLARAVEDRVRAEYKKRFDVAMKESATIPPVFAVALAKMEESSGTTYHVQLTNTLLRKPDAHPIFDTEGTITAFYSNVLEHAEMEAQEWAEFLGVKTVTSFAAPEDLSQSNDSASIDNEKDALPRDFNAANISALSADQQAMLSCLDELVKIVGAEDCSDDGKSGTVMVTGPLQNIIFQNTGWSEAYYGRVMGKPLRIQRCGPGSLELWCDGIYIEGSGVRRVIHKSKRAFFESIQ